MNVFSMSLSYFLIKQGLRKLLFNDGVTGGEYETHIKHAYFCEDVLVF